jgi:hypothetical protein
MSAVMAALYETEVRQNVDRAFLLKFEINGRKYRGTVAPPRAPTATGQDVSTSVRIVGGFMMRLWEPEDIERVIFVSLDAVAVCEIEWLDGRD